jgi:diguanylate cyclase (GGDEF)-like protein
MALAHASDRDRSTATDGLVCGGLGLPSTYGVAQRVVESATRNGREGTRPTAGWPAIAAVIATVAVYLVIVALGSGTTWPMVVFGDLALVAAPLFAAISCVIAYRRVTGSARYGWALIGAGMAAWLLGELIWCFFELIRHWAIPYPSLADVFYLLTLPLMIAGMLALFTVRPSAVRALLDAFIVSASLLFVTWAFIVGPSIDQGQGNRWATVVGLAYPLGDVALVTMALILLGHLAPDQWEPVGMLVVGVLLLALSDSLFVYLAERGAYVAGTFADVGWFSGFLVMGLAALSARTEHGRPDTYHNSTLWVMLPYVPLAVAITTGIVLTLRYGWIGTFLYLLGMLIVILVAARQLVDARENRTLTRQLGVAVHGLRVRERQLHHLAFHDQLTGLANRGLFLDRAEHAVARQNSGDEIMAVFFIDLDGFKQVNDELGHRAGDRLLRAVADRLLGCVGPYDTLARLGGDEFAVLYERLRTAEEAETAADRITCALMPPYDVDGYRIRISGSVGVALRGAGRAPAEDMLHRADSAMYAAKLGGKGRYVIASAEEPHLLTEPRRSSTGDFGQTSPVIDPLRDIRL